jgi:hypothetical protein
MVAPGVWKDMGPSSARTLGHYAAPVGEMAPIITGDMPPTPAMARRRAARRAREAAKAQP